MQEDYSFESEVFALYAAFAAAAWDWRTCAACRSGCSTSPWSSMSACSGGLIYSFHLPFAQPAVFYLKAPTLLHLPVDRAAGAPLRGALRRFAG